VSIRVVFVDWASTLSTSLFWQQSPGSRLSAADSARVESYVFGHPALVRQWMRGTVAAEDICTLAAGSLGLAAADLLADLELSCRGFEFYDPAAVDVLRAIRERGIKVVLATDNMDTLTRWTAPALRLGDMFDAILNSASLGALKNDLVDGQSPFFGPWLDSEQAAPSETVLVDNSPAAAAGAIGIELRVVEHPGKLAAVLTQLGLDAAPARTDCGARDRNGAD
jgi:FMN phosphatase YigB (HAD superfamily)